MKTTLILSAIVFTFVFTGCNKEEDPMLVSSMFKVSIENVMDEKDFLSSGVFNTPVGASEPGGAGPGNMYQFSFEAGPGTKLSFATMFVTSNDLYYAPSGEGIELFSGSGVGMAEDRVVKDISMIDDGFTYPAVSENIMVSIENDGATGFTVTIKNMENSTTPIAPGVWVVHTMDNPLFEVGMADSGSGLKGLAEDGDPSSLAGHLDMNSEYFSPLAPGAWAVHASSIMPIFTDMSSDMGEGLENLAENGDPSSLATSLMGKTGVNSSGAFSTPSGSSGPGPLMPGNSYEFTFEAQEGDYLSFATMLVHTNDLFFSPSDMGIALYQGGKALSGNITSSIMLYDAGTEPNELPGVGIHQPARLNGGSAENGSVRTVDDMYTYPAVSSVVKITITPM